MVARAVLAGGALEHPEIDDVVVFEPLLGLVDDDCLAFRQFHGHAGLLGVEELALALVQLLGHRRCHRVLVHEEIVPVRLIIKVCLQNPFFLLLVVRRGLHLLVLHVCCANVFPCICLLGHCFLLIFIFRVVRWVDYFAIVSSRELFILGGFLLCRLDV